MVESFAKSMVGSMVGYMVTWLVTWLSSIFVLKSFGGFNSVEKA